MKKFIAYIILSLIMIIPIKINAEVTTRVECPGSVNAGSTFNCQVFASFSADDSSINLAISSTNATIQNGIGINDFYYSDNTLSYNNDGNEMDNNPIGQLTFKAFDDEPNGSNRTATINVGSASTEVTIIDIKNSDNNLRTLSISGYPFSFNANTTNYDLTINQASITISATADQTASISGTGTINLSYGLNVVRIIVTAENGSSKTYTLNITRNDTRNTSNYLSSLSLSTGTLSPRFSKDNLAYTATVANNVSSLSIRATLANQTASFVQGQGPRNVNLSVGKNTFNISVKAQNGAVRTYVITITRENKSNSNSNINSMNSSSDDNVYLKTLEVTPGNIVFDKNVYEYNISVENDVTKVNVKAVPENSNHKVTITGNDNLIEGDNKITIEVINSNGKKTTYIINVKRIAKDETLSENNNIKDLTIDNYNIKFNKNKKTYELKIKNEKKLNIIAVAEDDKATVIIKGNEKLKNNSIIEISVFAENGDENTYTIRIVKDSINILYIIIPIAGLVIVALIVLFVVLIIKNSNSNNGNRLKKQKKVKYKMPKNVISADLLSKR